MGMERRQLVKVGLMASAGLLLQGEPAAADPRSEAELLADPDAALQALLEGNGRFAEHHQVFPHQAKARLKEVAQVQHPFATVLTCADSRVPVELLFDQGVGDIFDVRVAGNVVTPAVMGSLEYAIELLETPVLMVLGHERCGAVTAAVQGGPDNGPLPGQIGRFVEAILPAVEESRGLPGDVVENAVLENVRYQLALVGRSPLVARRVAAGQLMLVGGRYDLDSGKVTLVT